MFYAAPQHSYAASGQAATTTTTGTGGAQEPSIADVEAQVTAEEAELTKLENRAERLELVFALIAAFATAFGVGEALGKALGIRRRRREARLALEASSVRTPADAARAESLASE